MSNAVEHDAAASSNANHQPPLTGRSVVLFIPNIIGYLRVFFMAASFSVMIGMPSQWFLALVCYILSFAGDLIDGWAARKFNQCSSFGGLLDMVTDRVATTGLLSVLSGIYVPPQYDALTSAVLRWMFVLLILLDISSHWCQVYSTASLQQKHHKSVEGNADRFVLVQWYYRYYAFFGYCCVGTEITYMTLYVLACWQPPPALQWGVYLWWGLCIPACVTKQVVNVVQLLSACYAVASHDAEVANEERKKVGSSKSSSNKTD